VTAGMEIIKQQSVWNEIVGQFDKRDFFHSVEYHNSCGKDTNLPLASLIWCRFTDIQDRSVTTTRRFLNIWIRLKFNWRKWVAFHAFAECILFFTKMSRSMNH